MDDHTLTSDPQENDAQEVLQQDVRSGLGGFVAPTLGHPRDAPATPAAAAAAGAFGGGGVAGAAGVPDPVIDTSKAPLDALEDALDWMCLSNRAFLGQYVVLGSVDRRRGGQGVVQFMRRCVQSLRPEIFLLVLLFGSPVLRVMHAC